MVSCLNNEGILKCVSVVLGIVMNYGRKDLFLIIIFSVTSTHTIYMNIFRVSCPNDKTERFYFDTSAHNTFHN